MKKLLCIISTVLTLSMTACSTEAPNSNASGGASLAEQVESKNSLHTIGSAEETEPGSRPNTPAEINSSEAMENEDMKIKVSDGNNEIIFLLNDSSAAKSLYGQLPLTLEVENYGSNEKIFYPPEKLDGSDVTEGGGQTGGLAYFSPWGDVVMYYAPFEAYPGLYVLGEATEGSDNIQKLSGTISVTAD